LAQLYLKIYQIFFFWGGGGHIRGHTVFPTQNECVKTTNFKTLHM